MAAATASSTVSINEERVTQAEKNLSVGLGAKPALLQAKVDLNAQIAARLKQQTLIDQLKEQLNELMVMARETRYEVSDSIPIRNDLVVTEILQAAETNNPQLQVARQNISIAKLTLKERKAERFEKVIEECRDFKDRFPQSELSKQVEDFINQSQNNLKIYTNEPVKTST